jgi:hypothetical protein
MDLYYIPAEAPRFFPNHGLSLEQRTCHEQKADKIATYE